MSRSAGPVSTVEREVKAGGHVILWIILAIVAFIMLAPRAGEWFSHQAADAGVDTVKGVAEGTAEGAEGVCAKDGLNHACALPANGNRLGDPTTPTSAAPTPPAPQPYGPPNGPVRPLPSQLPPPTIPPADEPVLSGPQGGGSILGELPVVGPVINELGPSLAKALTP